MLKTRIELKDIFHQYPSGFELHADLEFSNSVVGVVGRNGAGKSTLFQILTQNLKPKKGKVLLNDQKLSTDETQLKKNFGYLPQKMHLPPWVSPLDLLNYASGLYKIPDPSKVIQDQIEYWKMQSYMNKPVSSGSHGMQKRVGLALANIHSPEVLIIDEPFAGLDIIHINSLQKLIRRRKEQGQTTLISSHIIPYISNLCDACCIVQDGKVQLIDNWDDLSSEQRKLHIESRVLSSD